MVGRQAAKIRCRKCEYLIQIAYRPNSDEFDVTATPPSGTPPPPSVPPPPRPPKGVPTAGQPATANQAIAGNNALGAGASAGAAGAAAAQRHRLGASAKESVIKDEGSGSKKPTAAVPGLPGLGSPRSRSGAALLSDAASYSRRPLAPLPPPPVPPLASAGLGSAAPSSPHASPAGAGLGSVMSMAGPAAAAPASPAPVSRAPVSTQLADQFRESVQAGGAVEDLPQEGWFVGVNGVPLGPIPLGDLRELALAGHIDRRSLVWRDGQPEWRPLGKFPGLARVIDDGVAPARPDAAPPAAPSRANNGAPTNGANGHAASHVATGFDVPRADAGERPSAWGDLDDEDDQDEQPTTVKGRVSVMPAGSAPLSASSFGAPPPVAPSPPSNPFGVTSSVVAPPTQLPELAPSPVMSAPPPVSAPSAPVSMISAIPDSLGDVEDGLRPRGRSKWYLIAAAIVFAFVLGAVVTHLMRASSSEKASDAALPPDDADARESVTTARAGLSARVSRPSADSALPASASLAPGSLLASLGSPRALGHSPSWDEPVTSSGLDATAIQRTVRRHSPGVRQNCWLRAIDARPPGVPTSVKLTATITVDADGQVQAVAVTGAPRGYPSLARCVETSVRSWQFPRSGAQTVTNVPFMFMGR